MGSVSFGFSLQYYNPKISRWEPIIEKTEFQIDMQKSEYAGKIPFVLTIEVDQILNFNVSYSMLEVLDSLNKEWQYYKEIKA